MKFFGIDISLPVRSFLEDIIGNYKSLDKINEQICLSSGINNFFIHNSDIVEMSQMLDRCSMIMASDNRLEYGDFQTNTRLTLDIVNALKDNGIQPKIVVEPTCGKGNFILAVLELFVDVERIFGIEIQEKYTWQAKFNILDFFLKNPQRNKPKITIANTSIFDYDYNLIKEEIKEKELLIIGNPPWVTNSMLGTIESKNLPVKSNFKQKKGLDAITGKGNFDIAEFITLDLIRNFESYNGSLAFLVKNSVIKNIVYELPQLKLQIDDLKKQNIDCKKEFEVNVDASLFTCKLNNKTEYFCQEFDFYTSKLKCSFGWRDNKFLSDFSYLDSKENIDGVCQLQWRQGVKHDCAKIMEFICEGGVYKNKLGEEFVIEQDLVYSLLKSSNLKNVYADETNRHTIITQKFVGQDTSYIQKFPKTFEYLNNHINEFRNRKSSIYKGKCDFSIFGVGDYSFKPYKIAISGLYKTFHFCLVKPQEDKPVMLDDTCYFIGFDTLEDAEYIWNLLNSEVVSAFLKSISFKDAKRMITKEVLMRIDLRKVASVLGMNISVIDTIIMNNRKQITLFI